MIEALDGRDDEGPSHPSVVCRISHLFSLRIPLRCSWRISQPEEFLPTADDIPSRGIQCSKKKKKIPPFSREREKKIKKTLSVALVVGEHDELDTEKGAPRSHELHPQFYVLMSQWDPQTLTAQRSSAAGFLKISSIP